MAKAVTTVASGRSSKGLPMWAKRVLGLIIAILVMSVWRAFDKAMTYEPPEKRLIGILEKAAQEINQEKSHKIEDGVRLDLVEALENPPTLHYHYTLIDSASSDLDATIFVQDFSPRAITKYCESMKWHIENGVHMTYSFKGNDDMSISAITVGPADCLH